MSAWPWRALVLIISTAPVQAGGDPLADAGGALVADDAAHAGAAEAELELGLLEGRVDRHDHRAERGDRVEADDEPGVVAQHQPDRVAGADAPLGEAAREPLDPLDEFAKAIRSSR